MPSEALAKEGRWTPHASFGGLTPSAYTSPHRNKKHVTYLAACALNALAPI